MRGRASRKNREACAEQACHRKSKQSVWDVLQGRIGQACTVCARVQAGRYCQERQGSYVTGKHGRMEALLILPAGGLSAGTRILLLLRKRKHCPLNVLRQDGARERTEP